MTHSNFGVTLKLTTETLFHTMAESMCTCECCVKGVWYTWNCNLYF